MIDKKSCLLYLLIIALIPFGCRTRTPVPSPSPAAKSLTQQPQQEQTSPEQNLESQIDGLLKQMASEEYKDREEATQKLTTLLKHLKEKERFAIGYLKKRFETSEDAEVRLRLERILDPYIRPWEYFEELRTLSGHKAPVISVSFSPDGKILSSGSLDTTVKLWDVESGKELRTFSGHTGVVYSVSFSPNGKLLASGDADGMVKLWGIPEK